MIRFNICVNIGDNDTTVKFYFVHNQWQIMSEDDMTKAFDNAVKELNRIYKDYGRFATEIGVTRLFKSFGFERTLP